MPSSLMKIFLYSPFIFLDSTKIVRPSTASLKVFTFSMNKKANVRFKYIKKENSSSSGIRRIKAILKWHIPPILGMMIKKVRASVRSLN